MLEARGWRKISLSQLLVRESILLKQFIREEYRKKNCDACNPAFWL